MIRRLLPLFLLLTTLSLPGLARSDSAPAWPAGLELGTTSWYRILLLGKPSGYLAIGTQIVHDDAQAELLEVSERLSLTVSMGGQPLKISADTATRYTHDLSPVEVRAHVDKLGVVSEATCRRVGDSLEMSYEEAGQRRDQTVPVPPDFGGELPIFLALARGEMQPGESRTASMFDPQVGALDEITITYLPDAPRSFTLGGQQRRGLPVREHAKNLGSDTLLWIGEDGNVLRMEMPTLMDATAEPVTEQEALATLTPLVLTNDIQLDRALPTPTSQITSLTLQADASIQDISDLLPTTPRQQVQGRGPSAQVLIRAQAPPTQTLPLPLDTKGFEEYLQSTTLAPVENPRLRDLARQIVGQETDSYAAALAINHWVYQHVRAVESQPSPINALNILDAMCGDCSEHSLLAAALDRAAGIPSRMITGLAAIGDKVYYHAWVEVYVGEWVEMDPTWNEDGVDAGHLQIADSNLDELTFARMNLNTGRTIGTLKLKVLDYHTRGNLP